MVYSNNGLKIDIFLFSAKCLALLGYGKDWLAQFQANGYGADRLVEKPGLRMGQHYKVVMTVHCHKLVPILIWS